MVYNSALASISVNATMVYNSAHASISVNATMVYNSVLALTRKYLNFIPDFSRFVLTRQTKKILLCQSVFNYVRLFCVYTIYSRVGGVLYFFFILNRTTNSLSVKRYTLEHFGQLMNLILTQINVVIFVVIATIFRRRILSCHWRGCHLAVIRRCHARNCCIVSFTNKKLVHICMRENPMEVH